jgi:leucyl/phenylalanyl-tRNA--protein transferase
MNSNVAGSVTIVLAEKWMNKKDLAKFFKISQFPPVTQAQDDGLLCFGGELEPEVLMDAYIHGVFPWPHEGYPLLWFFPFERGILEFSDLHVGKSLQKLARKNLYEFKLNTSFEKVIETCAKVPRKDQKGTWITPEMLNAYTKMFELGFILCVECYRKDTGSLVGGLYGVFIAGVFSGESMFGLEDNVSKLCVLEMARILKEKGLKWMDIQMVTPVMETLGGKYISRDEYLQKLKMSHKMYFTQE